jgi:hypothetical protein
MLASTLFGAAIASGAACNMGVPAAPEALSADAAPEAATLPFVATSAPVYVAKVKNLLVGLPPDDDEVKQVQADPSQLKALIDTWMALPQYQDKMLRFFELAFQQTQVTIADFADQTYPRTADNNLTTAPLLVQNASESFARTALELIGEGQPLTALVTTARLMMTPALMEFYAFVDSWQVDDAGKVTDRFRLANPNLSISLGAAQGPIPITETLDPTSPNYMHWYDPDVANPRAIAAMGAGCAEDPIVYPSNGATLHFILVGTIDNRKTTSGTTCGQFAGTAAAPQLTSTDYRTWKMVTIRSPGVGEAPTKFYDLPSLRSSAELVLQVPRVGFFSTPAFFANWQTNTSNQMRVTMNQALIVATGAQVDGTDSTSPPSTPGLDTAHASANSQCLACHRTLDPTRSILSSAYSWNYHNQTDPALQAQTGLFAFQGVIKSLANVNDLASTLATHPLFAQAWAQKLCFYANSAPCEADDPEFQRIVSVFVSSGHSWSTLVRELFASPLTTYASRTKTVSDTGEVVAVSRRDHLCAALNFRLGLTDVCGLDAITGSTYGATIPEIVSGLPSDGYGRGSVTPVLPNQPTLFYRAGTENICANIAALTVDAPPVAGAKQWSSLQSDAAIADFVQIVMALTPSDARYAQATQILKSHFSSAIAQGASATNALRSTFVAACLAPSAVSVGL